MIVTIVTELDLYDDDIREIPGLEYQIIKSVNEKIARVKAVTTHVGIPIKVAEAIEKETFYEGRLDL